MPQKDDRILTEVQQQTLNAIKRFMATHKGQSPTLSELEEILKIKTQTVVDRIEGLRRKGYIRKIPHKWRNLELVDRAVGDNAIVSVPLVGNVGADNMSVFAEREFDRFVQIEEKLLRGHRNVFALRVMGNSMRDADLFDGDYVIAEEASLAEVNTGTLVVAIVGDNAVVKRLRKNLSTVVLNPENKSEKYEPIVLAGDREDFQVIGRVVSTLSFSKEEEDSDVYPIINEI